MHRRLAGVVLALLLVVPARAQEALRSPEEFLGYPLGARFTPHHRVMAYVAHVAAASPNVRMEPYGESYEGRPLAVLYVATPENLERLEAIRRENLAAIGMAEGAPASAERPAIVWMSYNVHGDEAVSTEVAMQTLFELADPSNARTQAWLRDAVVVIDPCVNPDGRERYVSWYGSTRGAVPDPTPAAREHHQPWPGGRTNHYYFDLNRDWAWGVQQETRQRLALYNAWMPHVHVDFHEQGVDEPYYFAPAAEPFHPAVTPWQRAFQRKVGENNARYFDAESWLYFTGQVFDLLYPGYGDTWPTFNGAVGMTFEQAGAGAAGLAVRTAEGDTLTLAERIAHHHTTGLSTVETAARERAEVVREFTAFFEEARTQPSGEYATYVVKTADRPDARAVLAEHLELQGIRYGLAGRSHRARGFDFRRGETGPVTVEPGDLVVSTLQPKGVLARVLFEPRTALSDSVTYDITAWALPYAYGVGAYALDTPLEAVPPTAAAPVRTPPPGARPYAYLAEWRSPDDLRLLAALLREGIAVRVAERPFQAAGRTFTPGTLVVTRTGNEQLGEGFDRAVRAAAERLGQPLWTASSGFVPRGSDFGSDDVDLVAAPRVAVLSGEPVSPNALGEVWHFFDRQIEYPATLVDAGTFDDLALPDFDVLVLPDGRYHDVLTAERLERVTAWIRDGGRLVAMEGALAALAGKAGFALAEKERAPASDSLAERLAPYGERERRDISDAVPGSIYPVRLDPTHPLGFGYDETYFTLKRGDAAYAFLEEGWNVGVIRTDAPRSGFAGYRARQRLEDSLAFGVQEIGEGAVVYLVDDPLFRGFWHAGRLLFGNAVFLVGE